MAKAPQRLTMAQIAGAAKQAGWPPLLVPVVVAISMAESGGVPGAHNPDASTGDNSYGLMQMNMLGSMGPQRRQAWGLTDNAQLFDPVTNMKAALALYKSAGNRFTPWSTFTHGTYRQYLPGAAKAAGAPATPPTVVPNPGDGSTPAPAPPGGSQGLTAAYGVPAAFGLPGAAGWLTDLGNVAGHLASGNLAGLAGDAAGAVTDPNNPMGGTAAASVGLAAGLGGFLAIAVRGALWVGNPDNWLRVAKVTTGGALIVAGAATIARPVTAPAAEAGERLGMAVATDGASELTRGVAGRAAKVHKAAKDTAASKAAAASSAAKKTAGPVAKRPATAGAKP